MAAVFTDSDPQETRDWLNSFDGVIEAEGKNKAKYLLKELIDSARAQGIRPPDTTISPYANTIPTESAQIIPGDSLIAMKVASYVRWNAMAMVARANKNSDGLGGHIASFASSSTLYEVGFNWFFKGYDAPNGPDLIFFQGHSAPGMYARAYVEGRLDEEHLLNFRREVDGKGLPSYPHPYLMPDFWQFPTVSMGLGPLMAIYQARFMKYMQARGFTKIGERKVWAFMGDGESDEPESRGALSLAAREKLDNLIFVVNCNLQRLDGPVRGNGKIIDELEGTFNGAGWNVIKVIWGTEWDKLMKLDTKGILLEKFASMVDGEFQDIRSKGPGYLKESFFNSDPEIAELVKDMDENDLWQMTRGGHDPRKIYAAFAEAMRASDVPTVILVKTVKGFGMGKAGEASMGTHSQKKMDQESLASFRDRFSVPLKDSELEKLPFIRPADDSEEMAFIRRQRRKLGGSIPARRFNPPSLEIPPISDKLFKNPTEASKRDVSTTNAFVRLLSGLARDKKLGSYIVPIVPDEARTFGMEGMFRQLGIYAPSGQLYTPQDANSMMWYKESETGQILEEGITESGAFSSWLAAGTAGSNYSIPMIPFYIFYSMFGFQRIGDLAWVAGDIQARGFLMGATAGRTTLNGEGLQHQDGHGLLLAATYPTCRAYDPAFAYEMAVIVRDGLQKMYAERRNLFYYITLMNENYPQPALPKKSEEGIIKGIYLLKEVGGKKGEPKVQLMGSGTILREVIAAADLLMNDWNVQSDVWSVPGVNQLARDSMECERENLIHPETEARIPYLTQILKGHEGPVVFSSDYLRAYPEQLRRSIPNPLTVLGTDGFGRSDSRAKLRDFFEIDRRWVLLAALRALVNEGSLNSRVLTEAISKYGINPAKPNPLTD